MTHETRCRLIDALQAGADRSDPDIAREVGCSASTVRRYRRDLGIDAYRWRLFDWGGVDLSRPPTEIARELGCSVHAIYARRVRHRTYSARTWTAEQDAVVLARAKPDEEIAKDLGRSFSAIRQRRLRLNRRPRESA